ncbi:MAG TPA: Na+/H+ antiporter [Gemmatirosa sp.]
MDTITIGLVLVLAVVVSDLVARMLPVAVPRPLVQIALGAAISVAAHLRVELAPDLFFLLFLPPLLFLDGWRIPNDAVLKDARTILGLALGLVVFTVLGAGLLIHWMIPAMPLPVAFALAAVVSPTDPIAVSAIAARVPIPPRMMHILEGESLLNDASGLVCLRFAIAATLTGTFSLASAGLTFVWVAIGGVAVGAGVTWAITRVQRWSANRFGEDSGTEILTSVLIPFAAYLAAEEVHCSGILAAVAAGVTMSIVESSGRALAATRVRRVAVSDVMQLAVNGIIFVILGEQLPGIFGAAIETVRLTTHREPGWLVVYVLAITAGLALLRYVWVSTWLHVTLFRARGVAPRSGDPGVGALPVTTPNRRVVAAFSLAGVRGAVTLAGVLTLPLARPDGSPFPARALAITLAAGVILVSLVSASAGLPLLLADVELPSESPHAAEEDRTRGAAAEAAIMAVERALREAPAAGADVDARTAAGSRIVALYRRRIAQRTADGADADTTRHALAAERELQLVALEAERDEVFRRIRAREVGVETGQRLVRELDLLDTRLRA